MAFSRIAGYAIIPVNPFHETHQKMNGEASANLTASVSLVTPRPTPKIERSHIPALDGLRGVAIILVVASHSLPFQLSAYAGVRSTLKNLLCSAGLGVQLFFVLSGFLITGILLESKRSQNYFLNFYGRRVLRIFPLYYGTIVVFWAVAKLHGFNGGQLFLARLPWLLTYTPNLLMTLRNDWSAFNFGDIAMGHFWSLAVEEQFYLVWPAAVLWCSSKTLKRLCLLAIPLGLATRLVLLFAADNTAGAFVFTPCQADSIAMGAFLAVFVRERETTVATITWPLILVLMGGLAWVASCMDKSLLLTAGVTAFSGMSAGLLAVCLYTPFAALLFSNAALRAFGKYSYAIYVFHVFLLPLILPLRDRWGLPAFTVVFLALSYSAGWLSWHSYEKYFLRLKRRFPTETS